MAQLGEHAGAWHAPSSHHCKSTCCHASACIAPFCSYSGQRCLHTQQPVARQLSFTFGPALLGSYSGQRCKFGTVYCCTSCTLSGQSTHSGKSRCLNRHSAPPSSSAAPACALSSMPAKNLWLFLAMQLPMTPQWWSKRSCRAWQGGVASKGQQHWCSLRYTEVTVASKDRY